jgi:hypothetical protein
LRALDNLQAHERERAELHATRNSLHRRKPTAAGPLPSPLKRSASGDVFTLDELLAGLRGGLENSTLEREHGRSAEREAVERA